MPRVRKMNREYRELFAINAGAEHAAFIELLGDEKIAKRWSRLVDKWQKRFGMKLKR